jgi:tetratricopeptide (TPR) repeat protein
MKLILELLNLSKLNFLKLKSEKKYLVATKILSISIILILIIIDSSCSTSKNTSISRAYHNLTSHYNVYFNANESLKTGNRKLGNNPEDYSRLLPVFKYEDPESQGIVGADMDRAITKCAKTIKSHSITAKPKSQKKTYSQKEKDFLSKPDYCKWIDDAYLVMGKAHFYKGDYETALQTFLLITNKYSKESTKDEANLWLAKTYVQTKEYKNAENILIDLAKEKRWDNDYMREIDLLYASMYLKQRDFDNAAQKLNIVLTYKNKKKEKPRLQFILAQIYQNNSQYNLAIDNYKKVIKKNPNYDITFKSKINLAEIYEKNGANSAELKDQFLKMLKDEKNADYEDQLYYALGKIEQNQKNIDKAREYYLLSAKAKSSNKTQKAKTFLALGDLYYAGENFGLAEAYYDSTISVIEPTFPDYVVIYPVINSRKSLSKNLNIIYVEDSLQAFAKLPENERNNKIDALIQKIRDEEQKAIVANQNSNNDPYLMDEFNQNKVTDPGTGSNYYFYNPNTKSIGQTEFKKRWGDRKLEDNWRRSNKQTILDENDIVNNQDTMSNKTIDDKTKPLANNKSRDYYLQNVPLTSEKLDASNKKIESSLFNSGNIYYKDFNENKKAIAQFEKLLQRFPKTENRLEILIKIHTIYAAEPDYANAEKYKQIIVSEFPESMYAKLLTDPAFVQKVKKEQTEIEKLYQTAYERYTKKEYTEAIGYCDHSLKTYPENYLAPKFLFVKAMAYGETGNKSMLKENLELILQKYPDEEVAESAKAMMDILTGRKYEEKLYLPSPDTVHYFVLVYPKDKIDLKALRFKFVAFNAKNFTQDDLKVSAQTLDLGRDILLIQSFKNSKSSILYYQKVITEGILQEYSLFAPANFIISANNFKVFIQNKDTGKYLQFFDEQYLNQ